MTEEIIKTVGPGVDQSGGGPRPVWSEPDAPTIGDWLVFTADLQVEVYSGKAEVGQNIRTSLAQAVAEELRIPIERVRLALGDTARTPFDIGTFGSRTTPVMADRLHKVAATARQVLLQKAATTWQVPIDEVIVANGTITHPATGRSTDYWQLAAGQKLGEHWGDNAPVTPADQWTVAGQSVPKFAGRDFVTGRHRYTPDLRLPDMLVGRVLRPPSFGAVRTGLETSAASALPGVQVVIDGDFVGVVAPNRGIAQLAIDALQVTWQEPATTPPTDLFAYFKTHPAEATGYHRFAQVAYDLGAVAVGRALADHTLDAAYTVAYIAHAPLEPHAAVAEWQGDTLTVWTGTQRPFGVQDDLAKAFGVPEVKVRVIVPDTGGAYGGKHTGEVAIEAARLARAAGKPVQVVWSREEEFTWSYFRPAGLIEVRSGVRTNGEIVSWEYDNYNSGPESMRPPYAIPNQKVAFHPAESPLRQGSYRALAATANTFGRETHVDELAVLVGNDPLDFRRKNLHDARLLSVFEAAAKQFGWGTTQRQPGRGVGIAGGTEKGSYVATCAEVAVDPGTGDVKLLRIVEAFEGGAIVNPDGLRNQIEGAIVQAIGGALFERIQFGDGRILTNRFSSYRVPRFADVPVIEVVLLDRKDLPSAGAGEAPIIGLAPAVGNAIFNATGVRRRSLPLCGG